MKLHGENSTERKEGEEKTENEGDWSASLDPTKIEA